jgi:hypothetical protein
MARKKVSASSSKVKKKKKVRSKRAPYMVDPGFWRKRWIPALAVLLLATGLYMRALNYEYVLDDQIVITKNDFTQAGFAGIKDIFTTESFTGYFKQRRDLVAGARYRPLSIATFAVEYEVVGGLNRQVSHFLNALFYGLTALLLFRILAMCFPKDNDKKWYVSIAFWGAMLFALHPVHVEVVANIKGRDEILGLLGSLGAWYASMRYMDGKKWYWLGLSFVSLFAGLMAKENAITFLAVIPIAMLVFCQAKWKDLLITAAPVLVASALYLIIRLQVIGYLTTDQTITDLMNNPFVEMSESEKYATITYTLGKYLRLLFFPHPLSHDYYPYAIAIQSWGKPLVTLSLLLYALIGFSALRVLFKPNVFGFIAVYYLATLSIVSNIVFPVGTFMNERFIYMPSVAFCIFLPYLLLKYLPGNFGNRKSVLTFGLALLIVYALGFSVRSFTRIPAWKDALSLNASAVKVSKNSARANLFMCTALYNKALETQDPEEKARLLDQAERYVTRSLEIFPSYGNGLKMTAGVAAEQFKADKNINKLLSVFDDLLRRRPNIKYVDEYLEFLNGRNQYVPELKDFYYQIGYEYYGLQARFGNEAIKYLNYGLQVDPGDPRLNAAISHIYQLLGRTDDAARHAAIAEENLEKAKQQGQQR